MNTKRTNYSDIPPLTKAWFQKARHVTPEEVDAGRKAITAKLGMPVERQRVALSQNHSLKLAKNLRQTHVKTCDK